MSDAVTANELVEAITAWLGDVWPDLSGFPHALPDPSQSLTLEREPLFVVTCASGRYGFEDAHVDLIIGVQVHTSAKKPGEDQVFAARWLRDKIDAFGHALYAQPSLFGCRPDSSFTWSLPVAQPRPVWQAQISVGFTLAGASRPNGGFLV